MNPIKNQFAKIRLEFPALAQTVNNHSLVYLDSAATTLKPLTVINRISEYYRFETANVHRGAHYLADMGTQMYEATRDKVATFINAKSSNEIVFVRGTTEGLNLLAATIGTLLNKNDKIVLTIAEHHSNIVPWQILAEKMQLKIEFVDILDSGDLDYDDFAKKIKNAKLFCVTACSNTLGVEFDIAKLSRLSHEAGALVVVDGAQIVAHKRFDVQETNCDFFVFSGHKIYGPTGIGILYGKSEWLNKLPPYQSGGSMISEVTTEGSKYLLPPHLFEAGTPHICGVAGLGSAMDFLHGIGFENIQQHDRQLIEFCSHEMNKISGLRIYASQKEKLGSISFNIDSLHASDLGHLLDKFGIAVRVGHHCTQPLLRRLGIKGTVRASFGVYNDDTDVVRLIEGIKKAKEILS